MYCDYIFFIGVLFDLCSLIGDGIYVSWVVYSNDLGPLVGGL